MSRGASIGTRALLSLLACAGCQAVDVSAATEDLAILAFQVSDTVKAEPAVLSQIEQHIDAIARREPQAKGIDLRPPFNARKMILEVDEPTAASIATGKYQAWSSLHSQLRISRVEVDGRTVSIEYGETYNSPRLARDYQGLPGVLSASPSWMAGDGSWIYIRRGADGWRYIFDIGSGDCLAGCATHQLLFFVVDHSGRVLREDRWSTATDNDRSPAWVEEWKKQRQAQ
jgi:hypothetical protein